MKTLDSSQTQLLKKFYPEAYQNTVKKVQMQEKVALIICSTNFFKVVIQQKSKQWSPFLPMDLWKLLNGFLVKGNSSSKEQCIAAEHLEMVLKIFQENVECCLEVIPDFVLRSFTAFERFAKPTKLPAKTVNIIKGILSPENAIKLKSLYMQLGPDLSRELKPFQREGVEFGLKKNGRVLIGDEMGLGKTLQALAISVFYSIDWPFLVVCPSSLRFQWRDEASRWLKHKLSLSEICVIKAKNSEIPSNVKLVIISYDLISKNAKFQRPYKVVICDESHYLKNFQAKRTQILVPIIRNAKRAVLLSGTPALNKPVEIFQQISALLPEFCSHKDFASRYCEQQLNIYTKRLEFVRYKHPEELHCFLKHTVMIRRLKKDVQKELPPKIRSKIPVEIGSADKKIIDAKMKELNFNKDEILGKISDSKSPDRRLISELFTLTGLSKVPSALEFISCVLQSNSKFLIFAHHQKALDLIEEHAKKEKTDYIRIDGNTAPDGREIAVKRFQNDENCKMAILSITACSHGLNLTAAGTVVFVELFWVPGVMIQAEDRCHRIGTEHTTVNIYYLIAEGTVDEIVWKSLERKWAAMTSSLDGNKQTLSIQHNKSPLAFTPQQDFSECRLHQKVDSVIELLGKDEMIASSKNESSNVNNSDNIKKRKRNSDPVSQSILKFYPRKLKKKNFSEC